MRARELPGAAALGLLSSLLAHEASYGGGHAMGGAYHNALLAGCTLAALAALLMAASVAWAAGGRTLDGSIIAAKLRSSLPSLPALAGTTGLWFWLGEHVEPHHEAAPLLLIALFVIAAAWFVRLLAHGVLALLAAIVIAIRRNAFVPRRPGLHRLSLHLAPVSRQLLRAQRRYARPPPAAIPCA